MPVKQEVGAVLGSSARRFGDDHRMTGRGPKTRLHADALAMLNHPLRASMQVLPMLLLRRDAGEADIIAKLAIEPSLVGFEILSDRMHDGFMYQGMLAEQREVSG